MKICLSILSTSLLLTACGQMPVQDFGTPSPPTPAIATTTRTDPGNAPGDANVPAAAGSDGALYHFLGRVSPGLRDPNAPQQVMSWANSSVTGRVSGTTSVTVHTQYTADAAMQVSIDGGAPVAVTNPNQRLTGLDASKPHTVRLTKINEAEYSTVTFLGLEVDRGGKLEPAPPLSARRIEMIGDSISCGYGDLGTNSSCRGAASNEDTAQAHGPLTGAALRADVHVIAWSGRGVYRNFDGSTGLLVPELWRRENATNSNSLWSPQSFVPQVVVINLGTNDATPNTVDADAFQTAYSKLVAAVRSSYGADTHIFCAIGPMIGGDALNAERSDIQAVVTAANNKGDARVHFLEYTTQVINASGDNAGCDGHPNLAMQRSMSTQLTGAIQKLLNW